MIKQRERPKLALCTRIMPSLEVVLSHAKKNGYKALDYSLDWRLPFFSAYETKKFKETVQGNHLEIRYHLLFGPIEMGHKDRETALSSLKVLKRCLEIINHFGGKYATVHIGLGASPQDLSWKRAIQHLRELVRYGRSLNVKVCLENLKNGWTSEPQRFIELVEESGALVTFDIGHAFSSPQANNGGISCSKFIRMIAPKIVNAHIYEAESTSHLPPQNLKIIGPALSELLKTQCDWWVIELGEEQWIKHTRNLLDTFFDNNLQSAS